MGEPSLRRLAQDYLEAVKRRQPDNGPYEVHEVAVVSIAKIATLIARIEELETPLLDFFPDEGGK